MKIRPGDLVIPVDEREFLFSSIDQIADEVEPIDMIWMDDRPGIVLEVVPLQPPRDYEHVKVIVDEVVGWTCSDYIRRIY